LLIKYIQSFLWRVAKRLSYIEDARCLNTELNPISQLLALLGAHHILHVSKTRVKTGPFLPLLSNLGASCKQTFEEGLAFWRYGIWYIIYLLTAIGFTPGGISTVHIYTQTIHRTTQIQTIHRTTENNNRTTINNNRTTQITTNLEECGSCSIFVSFTSAFALQLRKNTEKSQPG
jgi:hypothetical protein